MKKTESIRELEREKWRKFKDGIYEPVPHIPNRPKTRADCENGCRPCPYVGCKYNTYLDVTDNGSIKYNFPDKEPHEIPANMSCVLDMAQEDHYDLTDRKAGVQLNSMEWIARALGYNSRNAVEIVYSGILKKLRKVADDVWFK